MQKPPLAVAAETAAVALVSLLARLRPGPPGAATRQNFHMLLVSLGVQNLSPLLKLSSTAAQAPPPTLPPGTPCHSAFGPRRHARSLAGSAGGLYSGGVRRLSEQRSVTSSPSTAETESRRRLDALFPAAPCLCAASDSSETCFYVEELLHLCMCGGEIVMTV